MTAGCSVPYVTVWIASNFGLEGYLGVGRSGVMGTIEVGGNGDKFGETTSVWCGVR